MTSRTRIIRFATTVVCALALGACTEETPKSADITPGAKPAAPPAAAEAPAAAPVAEAKAPGPAPDLNKPLVDRIRQALARDREIEADDIDVSARDGVVSLWGTVSSAKERERAAEVAGAVGGVQRVENKLAIAKGS
jgi:hypothetical protein